MVSTQTPLTCSRTDHLLPQSLLYNIITAKLAEAFDLTNLHAKLSDYNDNLRSIKRDPDQIGYRFTSDFPERPHFDLVIPSSSELQSPSQVCFSPDTYIPRKRQRLHSTLSPASSLRETIGLSAPDSTTGFSCPNCKMSYRTLSSLTYHIQRCRNMIYNKPLTTACKELAFEPENEAFVDDIPGDRSEVDGEEDTGEEHTGEEHTGEEEPSETPEEKACEEQKNPCEEQKKSPSEFVCGIRFSPEKEENDDSSSSSEVMVAYLVSEQTKIEQPESSEHSDTGTDPGQAATIMDCTENEENKTSRYSRRSTRVQGKPRQIMDKLLLDKIRQTKMRTTRGSKRPVGRPKKYSVIGTKSLSPKEEKSKEKPRLVLQIPFKGAAVKKPVPEKENLERDSKSVTKRLEKLVLTKVKVTTEELTNRTPTARSDAKLNFTCHYCICKFQSLWSARRHEYTVHGVGTPLTSDDLAARVGGTECKICQRNTAPVTPPPPPPLIGDEDTMWMCGVCGKNLHHKKLLVDHRTIHEHDQPPIPGEEGTYECQVCFSRSDSGSSLLKHVNRKHNPTLTCALCYMIFPSQLALASHSCGSDIKISCKHCTANFTSHSDHVRHMKTVHASLTHKLNQSACKLCDYTFSSALKYKVHQTIAHPTPDFLCLLCNKVQPSRAQLVHHVHMHHATLPFLCTVCEAGFPSQGLLLDHKVEHFK